MSTATQAFVEALPRAGEFAAAFDVSAHTPLPVDWLVAVTDVVKSREHINAGRYKAVNMAGVAMISAAMNELGTRQLPYIFGGDGAAIAVSPEVQTQLADILARTAVMAKEELGLELRAAIVPISQIRADGLDVRVRKVRVSDSIDNFAFSGGGIAHAEKLMKEGRFRIAAGAAGSRPDLAGLSCRWTPISAPGKKIVSVIAEPGEQATTESFIASARKLLALVGMEGNAGSPIPAEGPGVKWPVKGAELEAGISRGTRGRTATLWALHLQTLIALFLFKTGFKVGGFDPAHYQRTTGINTDFRKVQDGLRMTVSLDPQGIQRLEAFLEERRARKELRYGLSTQDEAVLTCFVPSILEDNHYHFLDGAGGGYAAAASAIRD